MEGSEPASLNHRPAGVDGGRQVAEHSDGLAAGRRLLQEGRAAEAALALQAVVDAAPESIEPRLWLGVALAQAGRLDDALKVLTEVAEDAPIAATVQYNLAVVLERTGDAFGAKQRYERVLKLVPDHRQARAAVERLKDAQPAPEPPEPGKASRRPGKADAPLGPATCLDDEIELLEWHAGARVPASQKDYEFFWSCWNNRGGGVPIGEEHYGGLIMDQLDRVSPRLQAPPGCIACGQPPVTTVKRSCSQVTRNVLRNPGAPALENLSPLGAKGNRAHFHCEWGLCSACASQWLQAKAVLRRLLQPPFTRFGGLMKVLSEKYDETKQVREAAIGKLSPAVAEQRDAILQQVWELLKPLGVLALPRPTTSLRVFSFSTGTWGELMRACSGMFPVFPPPRSGEIAVEALLLVHGEDVLGRIREANPGWVNTYQVQPAPSLSTDDEELARTMQWRGYTHVGRWMIGEALSRRRVTVRRLLATVVE